MDEKDLGEDGRVLDDVLLEGIAGGVLDPDVRQLIFSKAAYAVKQGLELEDFKAQMGVLRNRLAQSDPAFDAAEFERAIRRAWDAANE